MAAETYDRMTIAYGNVVKPANITSLTPGGISGFQTGFPADNLEYEDPWTMMKTNGISGAPTFYYQFTGSFYPRVLGILNHNLKSAGYATVAIAHYTASYMTVATRTIESDDDIWVGWTDSVPATLWRIQLNATANDFQIGSIFLGSRNVMTRNPSKAMVQQTRKTDMTVERSAGGAKLFNWGSAKRDASMTLSWERADMTDVLWFRQRSRDELLGVLPPEYFDVGEGVWPGQEPFWGYVDNRGMKPRGPGGINTGQQARYQFVVNLEGAV